MRIGVVSPRVDSWRASCGSSVVGPCRPSVGREADDEAGGERAKAVSETRQSAFGRGCALDCDRTEPVVDLGDEGADGRQRAAETECQRADLQVDPVRVLVRVIADSVDYPDHRSAHHICCKRSDREARTACVEAAELPAHPHADGGEEEREHEVAVLRCRLIDGRGEGGFDGKGAQKDERDTEARQPDVVIAEGDDSLQSLGPARAVALLHPQRGELAEDEAEEGDKEAYHVADDGVPAVLVHDHELDHRLVPR
mmetsp:Transcript_53218/g.113707  ORF Transcript_53218/g.113707 Transcript_53218/m.113707 type:complete len:255 (+) Transcript_53218:703-1467(+)